MDKDPRLLPLRSGASALGSELSEGQARSLLLLADELSRWNHKVSLTSVLDPTEVLEKHLLDSLAIAPELGGATSLLDLGTGAGFPGLPLKVLLPDLRVTLVDSAGKKVAFVKHAIRTLGLSGVRAVHVRARGRPNEEGLELHEAVVSRALHPLLDWLPLAAPYVAPGGRALSMLGKRPLERELEAAARESGFDEVFARSYQLPVSGAERTVAVARRGCCSTWNTGRKRRLGNRPAAPE